MLARLGALWEQVMSGLWLIPTLMAIGAVGLAWLTPNLSLDVESTSLAWWLSSGDPDSVKQFMSSLLTSMITLATLAISITMRSEEHTSELQSRGHLVCRLLLEKKNNDWTRIYL